MPIACTRCGASEPGEILTAPIAFAFKHDRGCGHGVGPLCVIKGKASKKVEESPKKEAFKKQKTKKLKKGEVSWEKSGEDTVSIITEGKAETLSTTDST